MRILIKITLTLIFLLLVGCTSVLNYQGFELSLLAVDQGLPLTHSTLSSTTTPTIQPTTFPAPQEITPTAPKFTPTFLPTFSATRSPSEKFSIIELSSKMGAPYDEEYTFSFDTSIWQPLYIFEEGQWIISQITTHQAPDCTIQIKVMKKEEFDIEKIKKLENQYRRMGVFGNARVSFDTYFYTSSSDEKGEILNVTYVLMGANGDKPYFIKPQYQAYSPLDQWEQCRPLVRQVLSNLTMKRIPLNQ